MNAGADRANGLPGWQHIRAAARLASALMESTSSAPARREIYRRLPTGGLLGVDDLAAGERLLVRLGLLTDGVSHGELVAAPGLAVLAALPPAEAWTLIVRAVITAQPMPWAIAAVVGGTPDYTMVPEEVRHLLSELGPEEREAALLAAAHRVDPEMLVATGGQGEALVIQVARNELIAAGRPDLAEQVHQVSLVSDQLGYDVTAPTVDGRNRRLEIKTSSSGRRVHLSRTEADVGARDPTWALVVCAQPSTLYGLEIVGWCSGPEILPMVPEDRHVRGRWADVVLTLPPGLLHPGLPA